MNNGHTYPQVGAVAVMSDGARVEVLPNEGDSEDAFTGFLLTSPSDISAFWDRSKIVRLITIKQHRGNYILKWSNRVPIWEGNFVRFNGYYSATTGKLDRGYLRTCAVHRLYVRKKINIDQAAKFLEGFVPKRAEKAIIEIWKGANT